MRFRRRKEKALSYRKPEVATLGSADELIEGSQLKTGHLFEGSGPPRAVIPAYEFDE